MPLPDYSVRTDSFGNYYFGGFQVDSIAEIGYGTATIDGSISEFETFLTYALGSGGWSGNSSTYYLRFPVGYDPQTGAVSSTNYRFTIANPCRINSRLTGGTTLVTALNANLTASIFGATRRQYAIANSHGIWVIGASLGSTGALGTSINAFYVGWVYDPVFPTNTLDRIRNAISGVPNSTVGYRTCGAENSTVAQTNYPSGVITCSSSTPGANVSDVIPINTSASNLAMGRIPNSIFYPGSSGLIAGQLYRIPPADDPDGNTEQNIWLCIGLARGWNGSSVVTSAGFTLVRVWSNNIT